MRKIKSKIKMYMFWRKYRQYRRDGISIALIQNRLFIRKIIRNYPVFHIEWHFRDKLFNIIDNIKDIKNKNSDRDTISLDDFGHKQGVNDTCNKILEIIQKELE